MTSTLAPSEGRRPRGAPALNPARGRPALLLLLLATFALRAWHADRPIVENYVGRQIPTAMVARNLDRGSGILHPQLDTGPFPNLFLVEPPVFAACAVGLRRSIGLPLDSCGRLVSALAATFGAWGVFGLARRRAGTTAGLMAVAAFGLFPVTIRYGRAFQPDMLMIGTQVAALRFWDEALACPKRWRWAAAWTLLAMSLALKVTSAFVLVPLLTLPGMRRPRRLGLLLSTLAPALLWYAHAAWLLRRGEGSRASADNGAIWLKVLVPTALLQGQTWLMAGRSLLLKAFTPIGFGLAAWGLSRGDRFTRTWAAAAAVALGALAGKLHHEYYWLLLAPPLAIAAGRAWAGCGKVGGVAVGLAFVGLAAMQSASTWRTPAEWAELPAAAEVVRAHVPPGVWVVAPEALLYRADRRGCRLEFAPAAQARAAGEWGGAIDPADPLALAEFYRAKGARFVADVGPDADDPARRAWREAVRGRYTVLVDRPGVVLLAEIRGVADVPR